MQSQTGKHHAGRTGLDRKNKLQSLPPPPEPQPSGLYGKDLSKCAETYLKCFDSRIALVYCSTPIHTSEESIFAFTALTTIEHAAYNTLIVKWVNMGVPRSYPIGWPEYSSIKIFF